MKRIGILFGDERTFADALLERLNGPGEVAAEPVSIGGVGVGSPRGYDLVVDLVSRRVPFYRSVVRGWAAEGTIVVGDTDAAGDRFTLMATAGSLGVAVPRAVLLPSHDRPPETSADTYRTLEYPIDWPAVFDAVGLPAVVRPISPAGGTPDERVATPEDFFALYARSGDQPLMLVEQIQAEGRVRCVVVGEEQVRVTPGASASADAVARAGVALARRLGLGIAVFEFAMRDGVPVLVDLVDPGRLDGALDAEALGWTADTLARWLVRRVFDESAGGTPARESRPTAPLPSVGLGRRVF